VVVHPRKGGTDPCVPVGYRVGATSGKDTPIDMKQFDEFLDYLVAVGFADESSPPVTADESFCAPQGVRRDLN